MSHTIWCAPLGLSAGVYTQVVGVRPCMSQGFRRLQKCVTEAGCHIVRCGGAQGEMTMACFS